MIILISGSSHSGKTNLSQKLLEKYKIPYLSIDHLKMGLIRSGQTSLTPEDDDKLTDYLWPILREIIKTAIENKQNLIIEGCYIPFDWQKDFTQEYLKEIKYICLVLSQNYIKTNFNKIKDYASIIEDRLDDSYCTQENLLKENQFYLDNCQKYKLNYILIDDKYKINDILNHLNIFQ